MRVLLTTGYVDAPSTQIYRRLLEDMNDSTDSSFHFGGKDYENYDVVLFMGYDPDVAAVRSVNREAMIGIIDVRPATGIPLAGADFLLANGVEMRDFWAGSVPGIFVYEPSWLVSGDHRSEVSDDSVLRIGYHGNLIHLNEMFPHITRAIETLGKERSVEFTAVYNIENLGKWTIGVPDSSLVETKHVQWAESAFVEHLAHVDVGITPNSTPLRDPLGAKRSQRVSRRTYLDDDTDTISRFKSNSNAGRLMVFAQYGIPVVSDPHPSAAKFVGDEIGGIMASSSAGWYAALNRFAVDKKFRTEMGEALREKWQQQASPSVLNRRFISFLENLRTSERKTVAGLDELRDYKFSSAAVITSRWTSFYGRLKRKISRTLGGS